MKDNIRKEIDNRKSNKDLSTMLKEAGILFTITIIAGLILGFVYELTKEPIAYQNALKEQNACKAVFTQASTFEEIPQEELPTTNMTSFNEMAEKNGVKLVKVYRALDDAQNQIGYVLQVLSTKGYGGNIEMMVGITSDSILNGISLLSISETPGLGMRAGEVLVPQFTNKTGITSFTYTKTGAVSDDQIDAISGATITTKAVTNAVNTGLYFFEQVLKEGGH